tara:strand:+ start:1977 stop:2246 length:270 start_codon:yes stop_codon:yes gene_type:complete
MASSILTLRLAEFSFDSLGIFARDAGDVAVVLKSLVEYCHIAAASRKYDSTNYMPEGRAIELVDELEKLVKGMNEKEGKANIQAISCRD